MLDPFKQKVFESFAVDPEQWEIVGEVKVYGSPANPQYAAVLTPRVTPEDLENLYASYEALGKRIKVRNKEPLGPNADLMALTAQSDTHVGSAADYVEQIRAATALSVNNLDALEQRFKPRGRLGVLFNGDIIHADSSSGSTTSGTHLEDYRASWDDMFREISAANIALVQTAAERAPVDVWVVGGNHDRHATFSMGVVLENVFRSHKSVRVFSSTDGLLYGVWGQNLFTFHHGDATADKKDLERITAAEVPKKWGATKFHYFFSGHGHTSFRGDGHFGLAALQPRGSYARRKLYTPSFQGVEGHVFHRDKGYVGGCTEQFKEDTKDEEVN